ncbi:hypothetical protein CEXT_78831 [Caerostris extrusa]|uniref:Uncharacterized protein n=1 Tax=Caerostris extrusa TaxID=172846 RepID=A0AAV4N934_CAEEX|nr:hypothetical protein CEXT_78831 [Caerostris extrusa]
MPPSLWWDFLFSPADGSLMQMNSLPDCWKRRENDFEIKAKINKLGIKDDSFGLSGERKSKNNDAPTVNKTASIFRFMLYLEDQTVATAGAKIGSSFKAEFITEQYGAHRQLKLMDAKQEPKARGFVFVSYSHC